MGAPPVGARFGEWTIVGVARPGDALLDVVSARAEVHAHARFAGTADVRLRAALVSEADACTRLEHLFEPRAAAGGRASIAPRLVARVDGPTGLLVVFQRLEGAPIGARTSPPEPEEALAWAAALAVGVADAHAAGVGHGALGVDAVWVADDGGVRVVGLAASSSGVVEPAIVAADAAGLASVLQRLAEAGADGVAEIAARLIDPDPAACWPVRHAADALALAVRQGRPVEPAKQAPPPEVPPPRPPPPRRGPTQVLDAVAVPAHARTTPTWDGEKSDTDTSLTSPLVERTNDTIGRYRLLSELGRGGMGVVFEAFDPDLERHVALKLLPAGRFADSGATRRFLREARAVARLQHPDIVPVLDMGQTIDGPWFTMALVRGPTLATTLATEGLMSWETCAALMARVARALHHAHERGVVHRDVKPGNILLEERQGDTTRDDAEVGVVQLSREPRLVDFGLALAPDQDVAITRQGGVIGTPSYMAPEQARGDRGEIGPATDVYGAAAVLYELLTGRPPYTGKTPMDVLRAVVSESPEDPRRIRPDLPRSLVDVVARAMSERPEDRYPTALAFAEDLDRVIQGESVGFARRAPWRVSRGRMLAGAFGIGLMVAVLVTAGMSQVRGFAASSREEGAAARWASMRERVEQASSSHRLEDAERLVRTFVRSENNAGTLAAVEAWSSLAHRAALASDLDRSRIAWVQAYLEAPDAESQGDALVGLARAHRAAWDVVGWWAAMSALGAAAPTRLDEDDARTLAADLRFARRATEPTDHTDPLFREMARALRVDAPLADVARWDPEGDGSFAWYGWVTGALLRLDGGVPVAPLPLTAPGLRDGQMVRSLVSRRGQPGLVLCDGPDRALFEATPGGMRHVGPLLTRALLTAVSADLDRDGVDEVWVADDQSVRRLLPDGRLVDAHPETTAAASMVKALQVMDVDRDGADELVASVGEWSAYDLRWFKPRDGGLVLAGREKLGVGSSVVPWRGPDGVSLLIGRSESWPSARVFSAGNPEGWPPGIWVVALDGDGGLKRKHHIAMDGDTRWETARAADLDGDGVDEIVAQRGDVLVVHRLEAQRWNPRMLPGLTLIAVADVDGDQDDELLVRGADDDGGRWWLGVGDQTPPRLPPLVVSSGEAYRASDSLARETWARGSMLARVGLIGDAAAVFMDLAEVAVQADDRAAAARRAAELFAVHGDHDAAARAWHLLGEIDANVDARQREAEAWQASGRFDLELAARGAEGGARSADLAFLTGPAAAWSFNAPLDPRWKIERPLALRRDASQGALVVNATPGPLMWTDLVVSEPGFMLDVELEAGSLDWSAALSIGLVSEGFAAEVVVEQHGGGLLYERRVQARTPGGGALSVAVPDTGRLRFRWAQEGESTRYALTVWVDDAEIAHERGISALPPPRDARVRLEVRTLGVGPAATRAALRGIRVSGMATAGASDVAAEVEREQALWATIVEGRTPSAELDPVGALVIAARQGRIDDAWAALRRAPEDGERGRDAALRHLLRFEPVAWSTALWARDPADAPARLWAAFVGLAHERPDAPDARAAGLDALVGLEHRRVPAAAREPFLHLLRLRIDVSLAAGRLDLARAVLDRLLAELEAEPALRHDDDALLHAKVVARGGDAEAALHALVAGLATARCPTVFADRAMVSPELEPLRLLPGWSALSSVAAGRSDPR